jgi:hypothetical protein
MTVDGGNILLSNGNAMLSSSASSPSQAALRVSPQWSAFTGEALSLDTTLAAASTFKWVYV